MPDKSVPTSTFPLSTVHNSRHSWPYSEDTLGICPMLGFWCVIRPVTAPLVITLPCTLLSSLRLSIHDSNSPTLFWIIRYSAISWASGKSIALRVPSSTMILPFSVFLVNLTPRIWSLVAICCLEPTLNTVTLSLSLLPVFSDQRSSTIGVKIVCIASVI